MSCEVRVSSANTVLRISITGRFDFNAHREFRKSYEGGPDVTEYIVDLGGADYVDSSALGMLLLLRERAGQKKVRIVNARPGVRRILEIANFQKLFALEAA